MPPGLAIPIGLLGLLTALPAAAQPKFTAEMAAISLALRKGEPFPEAVPASYPAEGTFEQIGHWIRDESRQREEQLSSRLDAALGIHPQCSVSAGMLRPEVLPLAEWARLVSRCRHDLISGDLSGRLAALRFVDVLGEACNRRPALRSVLPDDLLSVIGACIWDPNSTVRFLAMDQLAIWARRLGPDPSAALPFLCDGLLHPDATTREGAARALTRRLAFSDPAPCGTHGPSVVETLLIALDAAEPDGRCWFIATLGHTGASGALAVARLCSLLDDPDHLTRTTSLQALQNLGPVAADAAPTLVCHLSAADENWRSLVASAIGAIGPGAADAVPALVAALDDPSTLVQRRAARVLGDIGPAAAAALPRLRRAVAEQPQIFSRVAPEAIARIEINPSAP